MGFVPWLELATNLFLLLLSAAIGVASAWHRRGIGGNRRSLK